MYTVSETLRRTAVKPASNGKMKGSQESRRHKPVTHPVGVARKDGGGGQMLLSITNAPLLRGGKALARSTSRTMKVCTLVVVCTV